MNQATADFVRDHAGEDVRQLALQGVKDSEVDVLFALDQIAGRQVARRKLPSWAVIEGIVYPPHLSMEQCSSEQTARYKAVVIGKGERLVDLTGGFGVDFSFMAQGFAEATYVERQEHLCKIAQANFRLLGLQQAETICADSVEYLRQMQSADVIYLDPARRDSHGSRTYGISDCTPDVLSILDLLLSKASRILLKLSPMLDWRKAVNDVGEQWVREVHIVSADNECKELLLLLQPGIGRKLVCVNNENVFETTELSAAYPPQLVHALRPGSFLYEPNPSIMKAGCFGEVGRRFGVSQLAQNSHLFTTDSFIDDFPGRVFQIDAVTSMNKRELKENLKDILQANIAVRNFPISVADLRKRLKISEGGSTYIFATTLASMDRVLIICRKV